MEERSQHLNANHRNLVRFESEDDSNYRSVRNRLESTVGMIKAETKNLPGPMPMVDVAKDAEAQFEEQMRKIHEYLKVSQSSEDILSSLDERRLDGTCRWLTQKESFTEWQYSEDRRYFWLQGKPATGKSVMASHVVYHLQDSPCCYHFFKYSETSTTSISAFLRSMAYQLAHINADVRNAIYSLTQQGTPLDIKDFKNVWRVVFSGCVFKSRFHRP